MSSPTDMQAQIRSLSIPKEQRPGGHAPSRGFPFVKALVLLALIAAVSFAAYRFGPQLLERAGQASSASVEHGNEVEIRTMTVRLSGEPSAAPVLTATGKIVSDHRVAVATKVSGQITELFFEQGDRVRAGQTLARIEDVIYRARRDEAAARLERSIANLEFQKVNFERVSRLVEAESAPSIEYADAKRALEEAEATVEADRATLAWAEKTLRDCEVTAPIAGVILQRNVEVGDFVAAEGGRGANANAQFAIIADMSKLRVEVDISELDIIRIRKDMPCTITPDAYKERKYSGYVMWIDPGANYSKATVQVKVRIENPDEYLRVEGSAQVSFYNSRPEADATSTPSIWVPSTAVMTGSDGKASVFVVSDGRARRTVVETGRVEAGQTQILWGLSAGQVIVADGMSQVKEGQRVR